MDKGGDVSAPGGFSNAAPQRGQQLGNLMNCLHHVGYQGAAVSAEPFQGMVAIGQLLHGEQGLKLTWPEGRMQGENPAHVDYG